MSFTAPQTVDKAPEPRLKDTLCFVISEKKFFIDHFQTYFDFFNEMPRNLMISGHLRFSFFSRCGTFVQRRLNSVTSKGLHLIASMAAFNKD